MILVQIGRTYSEAGQGSVYRRPYDAKKQDGRDETTHGGPENKTKGQRDRRLSI